MRPRHSRTRFASWLVVVWMIASPILARADELRLTAADLFARSVSEQVRLAADGRSVELETGRLYEDDGPAAGYSYKPNEERLSDTVHACKALEVENPACRAATLLVGSRDALRVTINDRPLDVAAPRRTGNYWQTVAVPPDLLRPGANRICLSGTGKLWIARDDEFPFGSLGQITPPGRSSRSDDGGQTWNQGRLGPKGDIAGEYYVRLHLEQFRSEGSARLPVFDVGNLPGRSIARPLKAPGHLVVEVDADTSNASSNATGPVALRLRSGETPNAGDPSWSDWRNISNGARIDQLGGRYFQVQVDLTTTDPLTTPRVKGLRIETRPEYAEDWSAGWQVAEPRNPAIIRSSIPFTHEPFDHPRLRELRERHRLDDVVRGAESEFALITRLAAWSATRWKRGHLGEQYPAWDALEILEMHADGTPIGGFCQQYNLVFLQACESFGIPGRCVSIGPGDFDVGIRGGHEVVEVWSNDFRKWIYVDGNMAWYATDPGSNVPLSLWELRQRQLALVGKLTPPEIRVTHLLDKGPRWEGLAAWPGFLELRLIPRSNFLQQSAPLPLNQGMRGWFWTGHYVWTDDAAPASRLYSQRVSDRRNWEWSVNDVHIRLEASETPNELIVHLESPMPGLVGFDATFDEGTLAPVASGHRWKLRPGVNRLSVQARNSAGRRGPPSEVMVRR